MQNAERLHDILNADKKDDFYMTPGTRPVIMAVDDDPVILNSLVSTLKAEFSLRPCTSGRAALGLLAREKVDLILLDYKMPDMSGFEVLTELRADTRTKEIPVIILTGSIDSDSEVEALELGAVDYITKPILARLLLTRVRVQLELHTHRKQLEALVEERTRNLNAAYSKLKAREEVTLSMLAKATDLRDHDTGGHIERTTEFVRVLVEDILSDQCPDYSISRDEADEIIRSSKLHDLGKIAMPDHVLLKPGRLSNDEFNIVKRHTTDGEKFLSDFVRKMDDSFLDTARDIAYAHHEKWDGTGYPLGLKGAEIPLAGRIVAVADVYDALTSKRPYKNAFSHAQAVSIILSNRGTHFDPYLVDIFSRHSETFRQISEHVGAPVREGAEVC